MINEPWTAEGFLCHHGIKGMKWGVRRYQNPDGALTEEGKKRYGNLNKTASSSAQMDSVKSLYNELDSFDYGAIINGKRITDDSYYDIDFGKDYKTIPVEEMKKNKIGNCWDFVNYQHHMFKENGIPDKTYMFVSQRSDDPNDVITHTFSTIRVGDKNYWFEQSFYKYRGIHEIKNEKDVISTLNDAYKLNGKPIDVFEFNPDGMDKGLSDKEYFSRATSGEPVYQRKKGSK